MSKHTDPRRSPSRSAKWVEEEWQDVFQGTGSIYAVDTTGHIDCILGDYLVEAEPETWPKQYRANRLRRARESRPVPKLPKTSLGDKVMIVFGPEVSARQAASALKRVLTDISKSGLLIGRDEEENCPIERLDGSISGG